MKSLVLMLVLVAVQCAFSEEKQVNLCGRQLARARVLLCFGVENAAENKRSPNDILDSYESGAKLGDGWVWGGRRDALAARWARHKRGLVDECCLKPCSTDVIRMYC